MLASPSVTCIILLVYMCGYLHSLIPQSTCAVVMLPQFSGNQQNTVKYQVSILLSDSEYHMSNGGNLISPNNITKQTDCSFTIQIRANTIHILMARQLYLG